MEHIFMPLKMFSIQFSLDVFFGVSPNSSVSEICNKMLVLDPSCYPADQILENMDITVYQQIPDIPYVCGKVFNCIPCTLLSTSYWGRKCMALLAGGGKSILNIF